MVAVSDARKTNYLFPTAFRVGSIPFFLDFKFKYFTEQLARV